MLLRTIRWWTLGAVVVLVLGLAGAGWAGPYNLSIGLNFTGSTLNDSPFIPPDTMGTVGSNHIVELVNGRYAVYNKSTGALLQSSSLNQFWTDSGAGFAGSFSFDPRVLYDPVAQRYVAAAVDGDGDVNHFLVAVSKTSDPLAGWSGFAISSSSDGSHWADFPTLGMDADGIYLAANMFPVSSGSETTSLLVLPKADLYGAVPTVANKTLFEVSDPNDTGFSIQPVVDQDNTGLPARLYSSYNPGAGQMKRSSITGGISSPSLDTADGFIAHTPYGDPANAEQPGPKANINVGDIRFSSNLIQRDGSIWGIESVAHPSRTGAALRWFQIDEATNALLQDHVISDPDLDLYYGSIAVNSNGVAVIGCSGSGISQYASSYAFLGQTQGGITQFGAPMLLKAGVADYQQLDNIGRNRWGDYSATVLDPNDPFTFWTFQEWASEPNPFLYGDSWSTQITQLTVSAPSPGSVPELPPVALAALGLVPLGLRLRRKR